MISLQRFSFDKINIQNVKLYKVNKNGDLTSIILDEQTAKKVIESIKSNFGYFNAFDKFSDF